MKKFKLKFPVLFYHLYDVITQNGYGSGLMEHNL